MSVVFTKKIARSLSGAETKGFESKEGGVNLWNVSAVGGNGQKKWCLVAMRQVNSVTYQICLQGVVLSVVHNVLE